MNPIYFIPAIPVLFIIGGVYFTFFAKRDQAREFVQQLFDEQDRSEHIKRIQQHHFILKKKNKDQSPFMQKLDMDMERANLMLKPNEFILISLGFCLLGFMFPFIMGKGFLIALGCAVVGLFLPKLYLKVRIMFRMKKARAQFPDVLDMMVSCFKSGYGFSRAVQVVSENFTDPWSTELSKVATEMNFGSTLDDALFSLAKRVPNPDVALFVTAVLIQKETGGNLAGLLQNLSNTIRERYKLISKVGALSAQGKLSAVVVFLLPFGLAGILTLLMPVAMDHFAHNPIGQFLIGFALFWQAIGGVVLKKIVTLEV